MGVSMSAPAATPPAGQQQDLVNPPSQAYLLIVTVAVCLGFATPMVWIRLYVSLRLTKLFRWDDAFISLSWLGFVAYSTNALYSIKYGSFTDIWNITLGDRITWARILHAEELIYSVLIFTTKMSVLLLYQRIFVPTSGKRRWMRRLILAIIVFNALFYTAKTFVVAFSCNPRRKIWDPVVPGTCVDLYAVFIGTASLNVLSDLLIIMIPLAVIWKLRMPRRRKIEISLIFGFGVLGLISSIARLVYGILGAHDYNQTIALCRIMLWTFGEITACFLASCVPVLPLFLRHPNQHIDISGSDNSHAHASRPYTQARNSWLTATSTSGCPQIGALRETCDFDDEDPFFWDDVAGESDSWADGSSVTTFATRATHVSRDITVCRTVEVASMPKAVADGRVRVGRNW